MSSTIVVETNRDRSSPSLPLLSSRESAYPQETVSIKSRIRYTPLLTQSPEQKWTSILLALYGAALLASSRKLLLLSYQNQSPSPLTNNPAIAGYIADRVQSRRWPFLIGLVALGAATALLCVGTTLGLWIAGRIFQGLSAAVVWTVGLALLVDTIGRDGIGQAMGYAGMAVTFGTLAGPLLGGVIYGKGGYYAVFGLCFGLIGVDVVLRLVMIERKYAVRWLEEQEEVEEDTGEMDVEEGAGEVDENEKKGIQNRTANDSSTTTTTTTPESEPKPKNTKGALLTLLSDERILVTIWAYFIFSLILTSFDSVLPIFVQDTFHWKQTAQGLIFIPVEVPHIIDPAIGAIIDRWPPTRRYLSAASYFGIVPFFVLLRLVDHNTTGQKVLLCALLALIGLCLATGMIPLMVEVTYAVMAKEEKTPDVFGKGGAMALAYGVLNSAYALGSVVGPFFAGFIRESAGWKTMTWALALITGVSGVPILLFVGGRIWRRNG